MLVSHNSESNLWQLWLQDNEELFLKIGSDARIGFLEMEVFNSSEGKAVLLTAEKGKRIKLNEVTFSGFRQLPADLLFVAPRKILKMLLEPNNGVQDNRFNECLRQREILFYVLNSATELEKKGYADFLDSLGLGFLGTCIG